MSAPAAKSDGQTVRVVFITLALDLAAFSLLFPLFPAMLDWYLPTFADTGVLAGVWNWLSDPTTPRLAVTAAFGGFLSGLFSLLQFFSARFWGALADRIGRRPVILITVAGLAACQFIWAFGASFWVFLASRALAGIFAGNIGVATAVIADVTPPERRARGMAWVGIAFALGFLVGPTIGGLTALVNLAPTATGDALLGLHPFSFPALVAGALGLINLLWVWRALPETRPKGEEGPPADQPGHAAAGLWGKASPAFLHASRLNFLLLFTLSAVEFCLTFLAVERLRLGPTSMIWIFVVISVTLALVQGGIVRPLAEKVGSFPFLIGGIWAIVLGNVGLAVAQGFVSFFGFLALLAAGIGLMQPTLSALASRYTAPDKAARDLGSFRAAGSLGRALGPFAAAAAFYQFGSVIMYGLGAALAMVAAFWALLLPRD